jgi:hypothetical protein
MVVKEDSRIFPFLQLGVCMDSVLLGVLDNATLYCPVSLGVEEDPVTGIDRPMESTIAIRAMIKLDERPTRDATRNQPNNHPGQKISGRFCQSVPPITATTVNAIVSGVKGRITLEPVFESPEVDSFGLVPLLGAKIRGYFEAVHWE